MTDVLRKLELQPVAGNITSIRSIVAAHMIDTSHFNPSAARVANRIKRREWTVETALVERSKVPHLYPHLSKSLECWNTNVLNVIVVKSGTTNQ